MSVKRRPRVVQCEINYVYRFLDEFANLVQNNRHFLRFRMTDRKFIDLPRKVKEARAKDGGITGEKK